MGLVFPLQPELRTSRPDKLVLKSSKKRFSLGASFIFGGALLGTMYLAASPLFKVLWTEGNLFDKSLAAFFYIPILLYPFLALLCWFFEEVVILEKISQDHFKIFAFEKFFSFRWKKREIASIAFSDLKVENWKGAVNMAHLDAEKIGKADRYATKGHWILRARSAQETVRPVDLEKRAKKEDIDLLRAQIENYFFHP